jgi:hypothetical protein
MKNKLLLIILSLLVIILNACSTASLMLTSKVSPDEIKDIQLFDPICYMSLVSKGNKAMFSDSVSDLSKKLLLKTISNLGEKIPVSGNISSLNLNVKAKLEDELYNMLKSNYEGTFSNIILTPTIDSILESKGKQFGMFIISSGFTRTELNYSNQIAKSIGLKLLTGGVYTQVPIKARTNVYVVIADSKNNNLAFFRRSKIDGKEPLDEKVINKQINDIFKGYFWTK